MDLDRSREQRENAGIISQYEEQTKLLERQLNIQKSIENVEYMRGKAEKRLFALGASVHAEAKTHYDTIINQWNEIATLERESANVQKLALQATTDAEFEAHMDRINMINVEIKDVKEMMGLHQNMLQLMELENEEELKKLGFYEQLRGELGRFSMRQFEFGRKLKGIWESIDKIMPNLAGYGPIITAGLSSFVLILQQTYSLFGELEDAAWDFRRAMGATRDAANEVYENATYIAAEFANVGVEFKGVTEATIALGKSLAGYHNVAQDIVANVALMSAQFGVAVEDSADFLRNMAAISQTTADTQMDMAMFVGSLSRAAGVGMDDVMKDIAKLSGDSLTMVSRMPLEVIKAAVEARRLGTTLKDMASGTRELLNFTENINAEMEASVLIGKNINLQRARELGYRRDIEGATKEILRIARNIDFENLDPFQMDAFARAAGRSVDELKKMLQAQRQIDDARSSSDPAVRRQLKLYEDLKEANEAIAKQHAEDAEYQMKTMANQQAMATLTQEWKKLMVEAGVVLYPVFLFGIRFLTLLVKIGPATMLVGKILSTWGVRFYNILKPVKAFVGWIASAAGWLGKITDWIGKTLPKIGAFFNLSLKFTGFAGMFMKAIPIIGWIITGLQFIYNLWRRRSDGEGWIESILGAAYDVIVKPFKDALNWILGWFGHGSPSKLSLNIVAGFKDAAGILFDVVTSPYRMAFGFIKNLFSKGLSSVFGEGSVITKASSMILKGLKAAGKLWFDAITWPFRAAINWIKGIFGKEMAKPEVGANIQKSVEYNVNGTKPVATPTTVPITPEKSLTKESPASDQRDQSFVDAVLESNNKLIKLMEEFRKDLLGGKIGVYVDGQLLSATISRQTEFQGGYGTNQVSVG